MDEKKLFTLNVAFMVLFLNLAYFFQLLPFYALP